MGITRRTALAATASVPIALGLSGPSALAQPRRRQGRGWIGLDEFDQSVRVPATQLQRVRGAAVDVPVIPEMPGLSSEQVVGADGVIRVKAPDGKLHLHPLVTCRYVIDRLRAYRSSRDPKELKAAAWQLDAVVRTFVMVEGAAFIPYDFQWQVIHRTYPAPWFSGMTQGIAVNAFAQMGVIPGHETYLAHAEALFASFRRRYVDRRTPWVSGIDREGMLWLDEYPIADGTLSEVYNGHSYAATALLTYYGLIRTRSPELASEVLAVVQGAFTTCFHYRNKCRLPGRASSYVVTEPMPHPHYHHVHIELMNSLYGHTGLRGFVQTMDAMISDFPLTLGPGTLVLAPGRHVLRRFDASGGVVAQKVFETGRATTCTASSRTKFDKGPGSVAPLMPIRDGFLAGWWATQVPGLSYLSGLAVDAVTFTSPRRVVFEPRNKVLGRAFGAGGQVLSSRTSSFARSSQATSYRRACILGQQMIHVEDGVFAGMWVPEGPKVHYQA